MVNEINFARAAVCLLYWLTLVAGCGRSGAVVPVQGRVLLDGKPVAGAAVLFEPTSGGVPATGTTDSEGKFSLTTTGQGPGAAVGAHNVSVSKQTFAQPGRKVEEGEIVAMKSETPVKYASPATSGLTVEVTKGMAPVELRLETGK